MAAKIRCSQRSGLQRQLSNRPVQVFVHLFARTSVHFAENAQRRGTIVSHHLQALQRFGEVRGAKAKKQDTSATSK